MTEPTHPAHHRDEVHLATRSELETGVVGLFDAPDDANRAFEVLTGLGYEPGEVGIMISESTRRSFLENSLLSHPAEPDEGEVAVSGDEPAQESDQKLMLAGAGAMSAVGALSGVLVAAGAAVVAPGLGLLLLGPLAGMGAGFGALVGGMYAVPAVEGEHYHELARRYAHEVEAGKVLIHVVPHDAGDEARITSAWNRIRGDES